MSVLGEHGMNKYIILTFIFHNCLIKVFCFFLPFDICRFCVVIRFFHPATTANDLRLQRIFYPRFYPLHLFSYINSWERASIFPFECSVLNKGTTGTIFITSSESTEALTSLYLGSCKLFYKSECNLLLM